MSKEEFLRLVERAIEEDAGVLTGAETLDDVGWDSLALMSFVSEVDEKLGVTLSSNAIASCKTISDLMQLVDIA